MDNAMDKGKGRVKQAAGDLTGDDDLRREGKADEAAGKAKDVVDKAKGAVDAVRDKITRD